MKHKLTSEDKKKKIESYAGVLKEMYGGPGSGPHKGGGSGGSEDKKITKGTSFGVKKDINTKDAYNNPLKIKTGDNVVVTDLGSGLTGRPSISVNGGEEIEIDDDTLFDIQKKSK